MCVCVFLFSRSKPVQLGRELCWEFWAYEHIPWCLPHAEITEWYSMCCLFYTCVCALSIGDLEIGDYSPAGCFLPLALLCAQRSDQPGVWCGVVLCPVWCWMECLLEQTGCCFVSLSFTKVGGMFVSYSSSGAAGFCCRWNTSEFGISCSTIIKQR